MSSDFSGSPLAKNVNSPRIVVLAKKSALQVHREGLDEGPRHERLEALLEQHDPSVARMCGADEQHRQTLDEVANCLHELGINHQIVVAAALDTFREVTHDQSADLVITVGGDGTLLAASHGIGRTKVLAINSAPDHSVGFFCAGTRNDVRKLLREALESTLPQTILTRMDVTKDTGSGPQLLTTRVLNEVLVCCASPAATSRYLLEYNGIEEEQKSSGLWIGPAAGSTAAQKSAGGEVLPFDSNQIQFVVREPYTPLGTTLRLTRGLVDQGKSLGLRIKMADARVFVDGPHEVHFITTGDHLHLHASNEPLCLLGVTARR